MSAAVWIFLQAIVWGMVCGIVYCLLRLSAFLFSIGRQLEFWIDGLFFLGVFLHIFGFSLRLLDGRLRFFVLIGWLLGGILFRFTFGDLILSAGRRIQRILCRFVRSVQQFVLKKSTPLGHND